jgi:hypothetical protein
MKLVGEQQNVKARRMSAAPGSIRRGR